MSLVTGKEILDAANVGGYAVGAFNINNMEIFQGIIRAAEEKNSPVIIATSESAIKYAGINYLVSMVKTAANITSVPIALHLDHGKNFEVIQKCIKYGYTSLMIDASHLSLDENIEETKKVVKTAHTHNVSVEAELGRLQGIEDNVSVLERDAILVNPQDAKLFVEETEIDSLAPAIGTSHGAFKFKGEAELDFERLDETKNLTKIPLVLHGASSVPENILKKAAKYGAKIPGAKGVPTEHIKKVIKLGINKINIDTDLRLAFTTAIREVFANSPEQFDPRKILGPARNAIYDVVKEKIDILGSADKAWEEELVL
ncbi:MAG: class II fructose-1,6-bisphosphate aldolase [Thermoplasmatales archaeon]|nr:MAG: class II fructose-1,6-bisphosphate aldolase [Thermoplasmatales archaeon]